MGTHERSRADAEEQEGAEGKRQGDAPPGNDPWRSQGALWLPWAMDPRVGFRGGAPSGAEGAWRCALLRWVTGRGGCSRPREWQQRWALLGHPGPRALCASFWRTCSAAVEGGGLRCPHSGGRTGTLTWRCLVSSSPESRSRPGHGGPQSPGSVIWAAARPRTEDGSARSGRQRGAPGGPQCDGWMRT